jgi:predicted acylesterase/phospholipase RssA
MDLAERHRVIFGSVPPIGGIAHSDRVKKQLRLGFAMGGGVSLGAFSGIALTEAIKLAVAHAAPDEEVVVDVFSGASAGAMSLALMLRSLIHADAASLGDARKQVASQFSDLFGKLSPKRQEDLAMAQYAQNVQRKVWEVEINLDELLGGEKIDLTHSPGILDRGAVDRIAQLYLTLPKGIDFEKKRLLGPRVLFAATLSNLTPLVADGRDDQDPGLADGMTSHFHRDLRVFDLRFFPVAQPIDEIRDPKCWCRYHLGEQKDGSLGDLRSQHTWAKIAATGIAAGAFPFAFGPVVLKRDQWEFDFGWPKVLPESIVEFPFTYVDGGVFNNEPIREAFRLASFLDAQEMQLPVDARAEITRKIIFVDPNIDQKSLDLRMPLHARWFLQKANRLGSFDGLDLERKTTLEMLIPTAMSIAGAVFEESNVVEGDNIHGIHELFAMRAELRKQLASAFTQAPTEKVLRELSTKCSDILKENRKARIPSAGLELWHELERIAKEEKWTDLAGKAYAFVSRPDPHQDPDAARWLTALVFLSFDLASDLAGKNAEIKPIAIAPMIDGVPKKLPGGELAGFAGFASHANARYERELAQHAATEKLIQAKLIPASARRDRPRPMTPLERERFARDIKLALGRLGTRVAEVLKRSHLEIFLPGIDSLIIGVAGGFVRRLLEDVPLDEPRSKLHYELRVNVPDRSYEFDGEGLGDQDIRPVELEPHRFALITFADYDPIAKTWSGAHLEDGRMIIDRNLRGGSIRLPLPSHADVLSANLTPHPIFVCALPASGDPPLWKAYPGVTPLEDELFPEG